MRTICVGEGSLMQEVVPRLLSHRYDVSYFSRCPKTSTAIPKPSIPLSALPQAIFESDCVIIFASNEQNSEYPLSRDALAALSNHSLLIIHDDTASIDNLNKRLIDTRADCFSMELSANQLSLTARPDQLIKWDALINAIIDSPRSANIECTEQANVVAGPWVRNNYLRAIEKLPAELG